MSPSMVSSQELPNVFAVMDPCPSLPSRYYVFMTYEASNSSLQVIHNLKFHRPFSVIVGNTDQPANKTKIYYSDIESEVIFWNLGIDILSDDNEVIPVLDFNVPVFLPRENRLSPVYVIPDTIITKSEHQIILRSRRNRMMSQADDRVYSTVSTIPPPPAIQRIHPCLEIKKPEESFNIPHHAAEIFVKYLIQEKKLCSITTKSFDETDVIGFTPCFHCFDCPALEEWLSNHRTCPECRSDVNSIVKYKR